MTDFHLWALFFTMFFSVLFADILYWRKPIKTSSLTVDLVTVAIIVAMSFAFGIVLLLTRDSQTFLSYLTGYIVELSLSVDNLFVFILIFQYFKVPHEYRHKVLLWGIIGAVIMRILMIVFGIYLVNNFKWIFYVFGAFLIYSGYVIVKTDHNSDEIKSSWLIDFVSKHLRMTKTMKSDDFIIVKNGKYYATPLFLCVLFVEKTDLVFALDSIPAILAITQNTLVVVSSNLFAVMGLRAMYFVLEKMIDKFSYLKYGLAVILVFIGIKMVLGVSYYHIPTIYSLFFILFVLSSSIAVSLLRLKKGIA